MNEQYEQKFRKAINDLTHVDKSLILMFDGKSTSLKDCILDKLIDEIEPSRWHLVKYKDTKFNIKKFWTEIANRHIITIFDGSYMQGYNDRSDEAKREIAFYEDQMQKYGYKIIQFKFENDNHFFAEETKKSNRIKLHGNDICKSEMFDYIVNYLTDEINKFLAEPVKKYKPIEHITKDVVDLTTIRNEYIYDAITWKKTQKKLQKEIKELHEKLIDKGKSALIVLQGIDGAGKSSAIRRIIDKMVPHWFNVFGIKAPTQEELEHHYLWRFWNKLPEKGEIIILDRSYYERLTAERVLKLNNNAWVNAVPEIREFERELEKHNICVIKLWVNISKDTQGERFKAREENPLKQWKISKADYATRKKWDEYQVVFGEMLGAFKDFHLIDGTNKKEARVQMMKYIVKDLKEFLKK